MTRSVHDSPASALDICGRLEVEQLAGYRGKRIAIAPRSAQTTATMLPRSYHEAASTPSFQHSQNCKGCLNLAHRRRRRRRRRRMGRRWWRRGRRRLRSWRRRLNPSAAVPNRAYQIGIRVSMRRPIRCPIRRPIRCSIRRLIMRRPIRCPRRRLASKRPRRRSIERLDPILSGPRRRLARRCPRRRLARRCPRRRLARRRPRRRLDPILREHEVTCGRRLDPHSEAALVHVLRLCRPSRRRARLAHLWGDEMAPW